MLRAIATQPHTRGFGPISPKAQHSLGQDVDAASDRRLTRNGQNHPSDPRARRKSGRLGLAEQVTGRETPMNAGIAPRSISSSERVTDLEAPRLSWRASLLLILALSLGLWAAIWVAVASLASVVIG